MTLLLLLLACPAPDDPGHDATIVGNPGKMTAKTAAGHGTEQTTGSLTVQTLALTPCDAADAVIVELDTTLALVEGTELDVPAGDYCGLELDVVPPLVLEGVGTEGGSFSLALDLATILLRSDGGFTVDEDLFVLELAFPGWLDAAEILDGAAGHQHIDADHPLHDRLAGAVSDSSGLYGDDDGDGDLDDDERARGSHASGEDRDDPHRDDRDTAERD